MELLQEDSHSDHSLITFQASVTAPTKNPLYYTDPAKLSACVQCCQIATPKLETIEEIDGFVQNLSSLLRDCIKKARKEIPTRQCRLPWWTPGLTKLKNTLRLISRQVRGAKNEPPLLEILTQTRKLTRSTYRKAMTQAQYSACRERCTTDRAWGDPFKRAKLGERIATPLLQKEDAIWSDMAPKALSCR